MEIIGLFVSILSLVAYYTIITKAGFPGWHFGAIVGGVVGGLALTFLTKIPFLAIIAGLVPLVYFFYFAFSDWPIMGNTNRSSQPRQAPTSWTCQICDADVTVGKTICPKCGASKWG